MKFIDALKLIEESVQEEVLREHEGGILVYCEGTASSKGDWHLVGKHQLAQNVMNDANAQKELISSLQNKRGL